MVLLLTKMQVGTNMKLKAKIKNDKIIVRVKFSLNEEMDEKELNTLTSRNIVGFLKPCLVRKKVLDFTGPLGIALEDYLKERMDAHKFFILMAQVTNAIRQVQGLGLIQGKLLLDIKYVYFNKLTNQLQFIYVPMASENGCGNVLGFMEAAAYQARSAAGENANFLIQFLYFLQSMGVCNIQALEDYISNQDSEVAKLIRRQIRENTWIMLPQDSDDFQTTLMNEDDSQTTLMNGAGAEYQTTVLNQVMDEDYPQTTLMYEEEDEYQTTLLDQDMGTMVLGDNMALSQPIHYPSLCNLTTNEKVIVNKPFFRLGYAKEYVDYYINNNTVSRSHADIITRNGHYYVEDLKSTNNTYINGAQLAPRIETEIRDGDILKLSNEEFVFHT